jgi:hypothetical protein
MGDWPSWWTIGVDVGFGVAAGVLLAGVIGGRRALVPVAVLAAAGIGAAIGFLVWRWDRAVGGIAGGAVGVLASEQIVRGALRRGGTRGGVAALLAGAAVVAAAVAVAPALGYVEAIGLPVLAARLRRRKPERYEGLRTLAKD